MALSRISLLTNRPSQQPEEPHRNVEFLAFSMFCAQWGTVETLTPQHPWLPSSHPMLYPAVPQALHTHTCPSSSHTPREALPLAKPQAQSGAYSGGK